MAQTSSYATDDGATADLQIPTDYSAPLLKVLSRLRSSSLIKSSWRRQTADSENKQTRRALSSTLRDQTQQQSLRSGKEKKARKDFLTFQTNAISSSQPLSKKRSSGLRAIRM